MLTAAQHAEFNELGVVGGHTKGTAACNSPWSWPKRMLQRLDAVPLADSRAAMQAAPRAPSVESS
jgi:hypothetical protein